ncbi:MAG: galactose-1-phosphate uridylyltransferase [Thermodesulfovibrionales bacterium]
MHELRKDPILGKWIAVLKESKSPEHYLEEGSRRAFREKFGTSCIFCTGREGETPPELYAHREHGAPPNSPQWDTRVIPNLRPLFQIEGDLGRRAVGMYDKMNSVGAHEIIIESPHHGIPPEDRGLSPMSGVVATYKNRISELEKDPRFRYLLLYKDCGRAKDMFYHPHSQLVATPVIPRGIKGELEGAKEYFFYKERCVFCDIIDEEMRSGERIVMETSHFIACTPYASKLPFEFWILPKRHHCAFQDIDEAEQEDFALILMTTLKKMRWILRDPAYSYILHTAPNRVPRKDHWHTLGEDFHWHMEIMPQLFLKSGFEWSSELYVTATSPEDAADYLRGASPL